MKLYCFITKLSHRQFLYKYSGVPACSEVMLNEYKLQNSQKKEFVTTAIMGMNMKQWFPANIHTSGGFYQLSLKQIICGSLEPFQLRMRKSDFESFHTSKW